MQNLKVLNRLRQLGQDESGVQDWAAWVNREGLAACEALAKADSSPFLFGHAPSLADICLVPQLANARRFKVDVSAFPRLLSVEAACLALPAFQQALPQNQPDFEP